MRAEQRHRPVLLKLVANSKEEEPVAEAKPFEVPKRLVWETRTSLPTGNLACFLRLGQEEPDEARVSRPVL